MGIFSNFWSWVFGDKTAPAATARPIPVIASSPDDRVLNVGVNAYPGNALHGCVNDVFSVKDYLKKDYLFLESNFQMLLDGQATTANILAGLRWLAATPAGARAYFHYSGHGTQVPDETDPRGMEDAICPVDFNWSPEFMITDKQLVEIFIKMDPTVRFNWSSDSCHSGDLFRALTPTKHVARSMPMPEGIEAALAGRKQGFKTFRRSMLNGTLNVGFISGCRSDQTSADTFMDGKPCGAYTYFMLKQMAANPKSIPLTELANAIRKDLAAHGYEQAPHADGARANKPFLG